MRPEGSSALPYWTSLRRTGEDKKYPIQDNSGEPDDPITPCLFIYVITDA